MKKTRKIWLALIMAMLMTAAMAIVAVASGENFSLTIQNSKGDITKNIYNLVKIATFDVAEEDGKKIHSNIKPEDAFQYFDAEEVLKFNESELKEYAAKLKEEALTAAVTATEINDGKIDSLDAGYYLLYETKHDENDTMIATDIILVAIDDDKVVTLKESEATVEKKILLEKSETNVSDTNPETPVDENVVAIGDIVTYQLKSTIPNYPVDAKNLQYYLTDTFSEGLTYGEIDGITYGKITSVTVGGIKIDEGNAGYKVEPITNEKGESGIKISLASDELIKENGGKEVIVKLTATLNEKAVVGSNGNPNSVKLTYTNNWDKNTTHDTDEDSVITYTGNLEILKVDAEENTKKLEGAEFAIYGPKQSKGFIGEGPDVDVSLSKAAAKNQKKAPEQTKEIDGTTYYLIGIITTEKDGLASITGLDNGTYYAVETKAPEGYNIDSTPKKLELTVEAKGEGKQLEQAGEMVTTKGNEATTAGNTVTWKVTNGDGTTATITNKKGITLPGTGGQGTVIFTIGGIALVLAAFAMFVAYIKKMKKTA
ncbi:MAG: SpaH/EbpB family LPXTG-anchored major pilin [Eubacteriales bacterium]|nr:SpaH/EbpB family LPXTG-anchored major pilin [Eubacteriales bacterium]